MKTDQNSQLSTVNSPLKDGYKQAAPSTGSGQGLGVIPEGWAVRPLLSAVRIANGQVDPKKEPYNSMILVAPDHIAGETGQLLLKRTASEQKAISGKYLFDAGDIVYSKIRPYLRKAILADFSGLCSADMYPLKPANDVFAGFMLPVILGEHFSKYAESVSVRSGMPKINRAELTEYSFPLPPLPEQRAIATALSDVDALLAAQDRLIAKKRDIKQAAMQQLLTGKQRLPGFSVEWEVKRLGDIAAFYKGKGLAKSELDPYGSEPCIHYGELFTRHPETISTILSRTNTTDSVFRSVTNDVLMPTSDVTPNGLARASCVQKTGIVLGGDILVIRANPKELNGSFLSYVIRQLREQVRQLVSGTTVFHLYSSDMKKFEFAMPSVAEQQAIVKILDDMDADLAVLEQQRDKTRALKLGMMQVLLTGKIRLTAN